MSKRMNRQHKVYLCKTVDGNVIKMIDPEVSGNGYLYLVNTSDPELWYLKEAKVESLERIE